MNTFGLQRSSFEQLASPFISKKQERPYEFLRLLARMVLQRFKQRDDSRESNGTITRSKLVKPKRFGRIIHFVPIEFGVLPGSFPTRGIPR
jgi:hypothetical protein